MKKLYSLIAAILISHSMMATVHMVSVSSFSFSPNDMTIDVGDTVMFMWVNGSHTTTSSTVPAGADSWDEPMNVANTMFEYVADIPGTYNYVCTPHSATMRGQFTVVSTSNVTSPVSIAEGLFLSPANNGTALNVGFTINRASVVKLSLIDLTGRVAKVLVNNVQPAGRYTEVFTTDELQKGIYIAEMIAGSERISRRIILQ